MTLRDYFAAKALQALVTRDDYSVASCKFRAPEGEWSMHVSFAAYELADAMLAQRKAQEDGK